MRREIESRSGAHRRASWAILFFVALSLLPGSLEATLPPHPEGPSPRFSENYTGAYLAIVLEGGLSWLDLDDGGPLPSFGLSGELSAVSNLFGLVVGLNRAGTHEAPNQWIARAALTAYPLFLVNLGSEPLWYAVASTFLRIGANLHLLDHQTQRWSPGVHLSFGADLPLTHPDKGSSFWLGLEGRLDTMEGETIDAPWISEWSALLRLSYRHNGLF